jgi:uncharacterized protein
MKFNEELSSGQYYSITAYDIGYVEINNKIINTTCLVSPNYAGEWDAGNFQALSAKQIPALIALKPEIILLGTGTKHILPNEPLLKILVNTHIGFEIMNTAAACRTYNLLMNEGRNVVAGLFMMEQQT